MVTLHSDGGGDVGRGDLLHADGQDARDNSGGGGGHGAPSSRGRVHPMYSSMNARYAALTIFTSNSRRLRLDTFARLTPLAVRISSTIVVEALSTKATTLAGIAPGNRLSGANCIGT